LTVLEKLLCILFIELIQKSIKYQNYKFSFISFHEIDDILLSSIERHLPPHKLHTGRPRSDLRKLMNGILYVINTGCTWAGISRNSAKKGETSVTMATRK